MTDEETKKLLKRFPLLYRAYYASMQETCMCWGFSCGSGWYNIIWQLSLAIEEELKQQHKFWWLYQKKVLLRDKFVNKWNDVLYILSPVGKQDIFAKTAQFFLGKKKYSFGEFDRVGLKSFKLERTPAFAVVQVKEKFATLRYYTNYCYEPIERFISLACRLSAYTCEKCGDRGKVRGHGWYYTACQKHARDPWDYTKEEFEEFKENTVEFIKWLQDQRLTEEEATKQFKGEDESE